MLITLPEPITIKQRWPESIAWSALQRREAVYMESREDLGDTHTRSSQRCFPYAGRKRLGSVGVWGQRVWGHWSVFTGSKLSGLAHMVFNVALQTDVPQLHMENRRSSYTHCIQKDKEWRQDEERQVDKWWALSSVTKTRVPYIHSNLEVAYKMEIFLSFFHPVAWLACSKNYRIWKTSV